MASEKILIEVSESGARIVKKNIEDIGKGAESTFSSVDKMKAALATLGVGFALKEAIDTVAQFEGAMARLGVTANLTGANFTDARDKILQLTAGSEFAASEVATSLATVSKAGLDVQQAFAALPAIMDLQEVGQLNLAEAADVVANALQRFKLGAGDAAQVVNVLGQAALKSRAGVSGFSDAFRAVGAVATSAKVPFSEISAALATLAEKGEQGSRAGLALKKVITELENPGKNAGKLRALGVDTDNLKVSQVGLTAVIKELGKANLTSGQAFEIFGDKAGPTISILLDAADRMEELSAQFKEGGFSAADAAVKLDDNLKGSLENLKGSLQAAILEFAKLGGSTLVRSIVDGVGKALIFVAQNAAVLEGILVSLAVSKLPAVVAGFARFGSLLLANPLGITVVALGAVIGLLAQFKDQIRVSADEVTTLGDVASAFGQQAREAFAGLPEIIGDSVSAVAPALGELVKAAGESFQGMVKFGALAFDSLLGVAQGVFAALIAAFQGIPRGIGEVFFEAVNLAIDALNGLLRKTQLILNTIITEVNRISANAGASLDLAPVALNAVENLKSPFAAAADELGDATGIAFRKGFEESSLVSDFVDGVFAQARGNAEAAKNATASPVDKGAAGGKPAAVPGLSSGGDKNLSDSLAKVNEQLAVELDLAGKTGTARALAQQQFQIEAQLRDSGLDLAKRENAETREQIRAQLELIESQRIKADVYNEIAGPEIEAVERRAALNELLREGAITEAEFAEAMLNLNVSTIASNDAMGGFLATLLKADVTAKQLGETIGNLVVGAVDRASGALADFALSGFQNVDSLREAFANLFRDLAKQIIQLIIKILILKAIKAGLGGVDLGGGGGAGVEGSAAGGNIVGGQPRLVGEKGPELIRPSTASNVVPNNRLENALAGRQETPPAPEVKVNIVNLTDPKQVQAAINSSEGEKTILNVLSKNRDSLKRMVNS